jgi:hypothetical protein
MGIGAFGAIIGFPMGGLIAVYLLWFTGPFVYGPEFGQVSFVLSLLALPAGAFVGAGLGAWTGSRRPGLFALTFIPAALALLASEIVQDHLRHVEEPRIFTIQVETEREDLPGRFPTTGRKFAGIIHADGVPHKVGGVVPKEFTHEASRLDFEITLIDGKKGLSAKPGESLTQRRKGAKKRCCNDWLWLDSPFLCGFAPLREISFPHAWWRSQKR